MPFGSSVVVSDGKDPQEIVDFGKVYEKLIEPALLSAGCEAFRADKEISAGDIRTDMFFELATADFVVAEISALNPNVFYELGVRNGLCPQGVFLIRGDWPWSRPFDIAPDRNFTYKSAYFQAGINTAVPEEDVEQLANVLRQAIKADPQKIGSPVYALLPGLKAADVSGIQTSKARYFTTLQDDWTEHVRNAQRKGRPGNIITLAEDAPTPVHRVEILFEAGKALIGLCRYGPAEKILRQILGIDPDHRRARIQLGLVLQHLNRPLEAEDEMRSVIRRYGEDPKASEILGEVYRYLWRLSWKVAKTGGEPPCDQAAEAQGHDTTKKRAKENASLALLAYQNFFHAHRTQPQAYFNGFNAALLLAIIDHLFDRRPDDFGATQVRDLLEPVRFAAECARRGADAGGDHDEHFWSTTTLSGLALLQANVDRKDPADSNLLKESLQLIKDACAFPQTTLFQMELLKQRLTLLVDLGFHRSFAKDAIEAVDEAARVHHTFCADNAIGHFGEVQNRPADQCIKVVLFYGGRLASGGETTRSAGDAIEWVTQRMNEALDSWSIGEGDLAIAPGIQEGDLLFAELCLQRGSSVRILLLEPSPQEISGALWPVMPDVWAEKFQKLAGDERVSIVRHAEELGPPPLNLSQAKSRHNRWVMHTARLAAEGAAHADFCGLVIMDENGANNPEGAMNPENPAFFVAGIRQSLNYQGNVKVIRPESPKIASVAAHS